MGEGTGGVMDVVLGRRYTRNPESPPLWIDIPIFFFTLDQLVKFCHLLLKSFFLTFFLFLTFVLNMVISFLHVYSFPFSFFLASVGSALKGGHCHEPRWVVSHVTPITLL